MSNNIDKAAALYDRLSGVFGVAEAVELIAQALDEKDAERRELHRRVQRLEGIEARANAVEERIAKLREGMRLENESRYREFKRIARAYRDRARADAALCLSFGISDRVDGHEHENVREGRLDILIRRLGERVTAAVAAERARILAIIEAQPYAPDTVAGREPGRQQWVKDEIARKVRGE